MPKAILFDFWGTLVEQGVKSPIKQVQEVLQIELPFAAYVPRFERALMTKPYGSLREAFQALCTEFDLEPQEQAIEACVGLWNKSWMLARPYEDTEEMLQRLSQNYLLVLVANTDQISVPNVLQKFQLEKYFKHCFFSYQMGSIKTEPEFLQQVLARLELPSEACCMVGDSLPSDIAPAQRAGIPAVLIDRNNRREVEEKVQTLRELEEKF